MTTLEFLSRYQAIIDQHHDSLLRYAYHDVDHEVSEELLLHPESKTSQEIIEFAYSLSERVLTFIDDAGLLYRVRHKWVEADEMSNQLMSANSFTTILDGILWIFSPIYGKELPVRILDGSILIVDQKIKEYLGSSNTKTAHQELITNPYLPFLNHLKNHFDHITPRMEHDLLKLTNLVAMQHPQNIIVREKFILCPECDIKLGFADDIVPHYCHNCGKRLKSISRKELNDDSLT